jgi:group I intron endonuclease
MYQRVCGYRSKGKQIIHNAINKYGIENFDIDIYYLTDFDKKGLHDLEEQLIIKFNSLEPNGYNVLKRGQSMIGFNHSDETKQKLSKVRTGKKLSEEHRKKISLGGMGKKMSPEAISNRVKSFTGFKHTEECKKRMSELKKGTKMSDEARINMSIARSGEKHNNYGKKVSEEERQRLAGLRKGIPNVNKGKKMPEEQRIKMLESRKRNKLLKESDPSLFK